jgi:hypothetical protein
VLSLDASARADNRFIRLHLLVEVCGGGMADFTYRNATRRPSHHPSDNHRAALVVAGIEPGNPTQASFPKSNSGEYRSRISTSFVFNSRDDIKSLPNDITSAQPPSIFRS